MAMLDIHADYIVHRGEKIKVVLDIKEFKEIERELGRIEEYEEALRLSQDTEFAKIIQEALSSPTILSNKSAEEVLNEI